MLLQHIKDEFALRAGFMDWAHLERNRSIPLMAEYEYLAIKEYARKEAIAFANFLSYHGNPEAITVEALYKRFEEQCG